jgi:hypothetical protein
MSFSITFTVILPTLLPVLRVTQNMQDKNLVAPIIDVSDQPAFVVADVKNHANSNVVRVPPAALDVPKVLPIR